MALQRPHLVPTKTLSPPRFFLSFPLGRAAAIASYYNGKKRRKEQEEEENGERLPGNVVRIYQPQNYSLLLIPVCLLSPPCCLWPRLVLCWVVWFGWSIGLFDCLVGYPLEMSLSCHPGCVCWLGFQSHCLGSCLFRWSSPGDVWLSVCVFFCLSVLFVSVSVCLSVCE